MKYLGINGDFCCLIDSPVKLNNANDVAQNSWKFRYGTYTEYGKDTITEVLKIEKSSLGKIIPLNYPIGIYDAKLDSGILFDFQTIQELKSHKHLKEKER